MRFSKMIAIPGSNRPPVPGATLVGKADLSERIDVSVYVRRTSRPHRWNAEARQNSLKLPRQRRYLSRSEFNAVFGADTSDLNKVAAWARAKKLTVRSSSVSKRRVVVRGSVARVGAAFGVELNDYAHEKLGSYRGRVGQVYIPHSLFGIVEGVFGLDTRKLGRPRRRRSRLLPQQWDRPAPGSRARGSANPFPGTFFPPEVAELYGFPAKFDGSGQNIAIFAFNGRRDGEPDGGYSRPALKTYFEKVLGGSMPSITDVVVSGPGNKPGADSPASERAGDVTGEVMLDLCVVGSVAPGARIFMYFTEHTSRGWADALHEAIIDENDISVISISYGTPEEDPYGAWTRMSMKVINTALESAAARGITVCVASGDDGSSGGAASGLTADFPATSPYVLGVGGTRLLASGGARRSIRSETVWNETHLNEGASGGGVSAIFARPWWQERVRTPHSPHPPYKIGRGVPDVAAVADLETGVVVIRVDGKRLEAVGGTSAAAPLWASLIARINQGLSARCGHLNPILYTRFASDVLRDITRGNNGAYAAARGWDACTGLGSPKGVALLSALAGRKPSRRAPRSAARAGTARRAKWRSGKRDARK
jgi:kumamolisin